MGRRLGSVVVAAVLLCAVVPPAGGEPDSEAAPRTSQVSPVEPLSVGRAVPAAAAKGRGIATVRTRASAVPNGAYRTSGIRPRVPVPSLQPWRQSTDEAYAHVPRDADGVRMYPVGSVLYEHPVGQAQYGLVSLETFRRRGAPGLLQRAQAQADRLIRTHVESRGAWFFPYRFSFALSRAGGLVMRAPWYSGMAQAEAVSLFAHLARTPDLSPGQRAIYREAATATFRSLTVGPVRGKPWVSMVDRAGYLWLQEYPETPPGRSDFTYNGHLFALLGLWDYARLTGDPQAVRLFDGAATTALHYSATVRRKEWASSYCAAHDAPTSKYHQIHVELLVQLQWLTGRAAFAARSDAFAADYPDPDVGGEVRFAAGRHVAFHFGSTGRVLARRGLTLTRPSVAPADQRVRIKGRDVFYRVTAGKLAGWFVPERPGRVVLTGVHLLRRYDPPRTVAVAPGSYVTAVVASDGAVTRSRVRLRTRTQLTYDRSAVVDGVSRIRVTAGPYAGRWFPAGP